MSTTCSGHLNMSNLTDLTERVARATGGGTGLGLMMARGFSSNDAKVYISGRRLEVLEKAATEYQFSSWFRRMSLTRKVQSMLSRSLRRQMEDLIYSSISSSFREPGYSGKWSSDTQSTLDTETLAAYGQELFDQTFERWSSVSHLNVVAVFFVTTAFLGLLAKGAGIGPGRMSSVIITSSGWGNTRLNWGYYAYGCSKAAVSHLTKLFATDRSLKCAPIRVNAICPGTFPSELTGITEALLQALQPNFMGSLAPNPMRRPGREEEMAAIAVYLASDASEYVQGQEIGIEGGFFLVNP